MVTWTTNRALNLCKQMAALKRAFPDSNAVVKRNKLQWISRLTPSPLSETYRIRLEYSLEKSPKVFVEEPPITEPEGRRLEHRFPDGSLCLYVPGVGEWQPEMLLVETIVPWTSEWLFHYELWLLTGEWYGGGIAPSDTPKIRKHEHN